MANKINDESNGWIMAGVGVDKAWGASWQARLTTRPGYIVTGKTECRAKWLIVTGAGEAKGVMLPNGQAWPGGLRPNMADCVAYCGRRGQ